MRRADDAARPARWRCGGSLPTFLPGPLFQAVCDRDADAMRAWVEQADPREVTDVSNTLIRDRWAGLGSRTVLLGLLLRHARTVPVRLVNEALRQPALVAQAAHNPALDDRQTYRIGVHLIAALGDPDVDPAELGRALTTLLESGKSSIPEFVEDLVRVVTSSPAGGNERSDPPGPEARKADRALDVLANLDLLTEAHLVRIVASHAMPRELVRRFAIDHPSAGPPVWLAGLTRGSVGTRTTLHRLLAAHGPALERPEVWDELVRSDDPEVLQRMLGLGSDGHWVGRDWLEVLRAAPPGRDRERGHEPRGRDLAPVIQALIRTDPAAAARVLPDAPDYVRRCLSREHVLALLKSADSAVRAGGFRLLGDVGGR